MIIHHQRGGLTAVAGTDSVTVTAGYNILMHIFVEAATGTTTFDVSLIDRYSDVTFLREDQTGQLNEMLMLPAYGNWTLTIANASADEAFTYLTVFRELD